MVYLQIVFSTSIIYLFIFFAFRMLGKRQLAQLSTVDLVFILLISNAVQNAMVSGDNSVGGGIVSALTLFFWNSLLKFIFYKFNLIDNLLQGKPVLLIYKGFIRDDNLVKLRISKDELLQVIREHGVERFDDVDLAIFEKDGNISVLSSGFSKQPNLKKRKFHKIIKQTSE